MRRRRSLPQNGMRLLRHVLDLHTGHGAILALRPPFHKSRWARGVGRNDLDACGSTISPGAHGCTTGSDLVRRGQTGPCAEGGMHMPELVVDFITSLDGYASAEGWPGWWGLQGPEYLAWLGERPERNYTLLMGANTYR